MGNSWFGSLELAAKYALVFGCLLAAVVILGVTKIIYDKRKMRKHIKLLNMDCERYKDSANSEKALAMREKDEGNLFGIRALEAGYYGGVAQSRGNSIANSLATSPSPSPINSNNHADFSRSKPIDQRMDSRSRVFSASSSILRLSRFSTSEEIEVVPANPNLTDASNNQRRKPANLSTVQLRPSTAEQNKRHTHSLAVNMDLQVPPSPLLHSEQRFSRDTTSSPIDSPTLPRFPQELPLLESSTTTLSSPPTPLSIPKPLPSPPKASPSSSNFLQYSPALPTSQETNKPHRNPSRGSSIFSGSSIFQEKVFPDYYMPPAPKVHLPGDIGKTPFEVQVLDNPHSDTRSVRGSLISRASIISHTTSKASYGPGRAKSPVPPVPRLSSAAPSTKLPAFPTKAIIDASSPKFSGFVKERAPRKVEPIPTGLKDSAKGYVEHPVLGMPTLPTSPSAIFPPSRTALRASLATTAAIDSPRTSFSFSMTEPDFATGSPETRKYRIGDIPMSSLTMEKSGLKPFTPLTLSIHNEQPLDFRV